MLTGQPGLLQRDPFQPMEPSGETTDRNVEVAANGQKFLVNAIVGDSDNVPIEVTLNWAAGLKK